MDELSARNRAIAAAINGIAISDPCQSDCPLVYVNEAFLKMTGYTEQEVMGRNCRLLQGPDTDPAAIQELREAVAEERACQVSLLNYRKDGTTFWNELTISPVRDAHNMLVHFVGVQSDVTLRHQIDTERRQTQDAFRDSKEILRESEARLRDAKARLEAAISAGGIATWTYDLTTDRVVADTGLARLFSVSPEDASGGSLSVYLQAVHPEDRPRVAEAISDAIGHGDVYQAEYRVVLPDGIVRWLSTRGKVERDAQGMAVSLPGVVEDITERIERGQRERFLADLAERARGLSDPDEVIADAVRALGEFFGVARCVFADIDIQTDTYTIPLDYCADETVVSMAGKFPISAFGSFLAGEYEAGRTVCVADVYRDSVRFPPENVVAYDAIGCCAFVAVPVLHSAHLVSVVAIHSAATRHWKPEEVHLLQAAVERTWLTVEVLRQQRTLARGAEEQRARAEREALVSRIGQILLATTDPAVIQERAVALLGEALGADRCYLSLWDTAGDRIFVLHDYRRADLPSIAGEFSASQYAPVMETLFAQGTAVVPDVCASGLPDAVIAMMTGFALSSILAVPFFDGAGQVTAALMVTMTDAPRPWTPEEVSLAVAVAALTRTAVETARLHQREHRIAEQLARALQPPNPTHIPGMELADYYRPAWEDQGVGGDFSDVFQADKGVTFLVVGDQSGKGLAAASSVAMTRHMLRFALYNGRTVAGAVASVSTTIADNSLLDGFCTLFVGRYDAASGELCYVNAGQDAGLVLRASTGEVEPLPPTGLVLGAFGGTLYTEGQVTLERGDVLALFTDGLTEAGPTRTALLTGDGVAILLRDLAGETNPQTIVERLMAGVDAHAGRGIRDDQCLLVGVVSKS